MPHYAMQRSVSLKLNEVLIQSVDHYNIMQYVLQTYSTSAETVKYQGSLTGMFLDSAGLFTSFENNEGLKQRENLIAFSRKVTTIGAMNYDISRSHLVLPPQTECTIAVEREQDDYVLMYDPAGEDKFKINIDKIEVIYERIRPSADITESLYREWILSKEIRYNFMRIFTACHFQISKDDVFIERVLSRSRKPEFLLMFMINENQEYANPAVNNFELQNSGLKQCQAFFESTGVPIQPYKCALPSSPADNTYDASEMFFDTLKLFGFMNSNSSCAIDEVRYLNGFFVVPFLMSSVSNITSGMISNNSEVGYMKLQLQFTSAARAQNVHCYVLAGTYSSIGITHDHLLNLDYQLSTLS
jgi:hypothetical protein